MKIKNSNAYSTSKCNVEDRQPTLDESNVCCCTCGMLEVLSRRNTLYTYNLLNEVRTNTRWKPDSKSIVTLFFLYYFFIFENDLKSTRKKFQIHVYLSVQMIRIGKTLYIHVTWVALLAVWRKYNRMKIPYMVVTNFF